MDPQKLTVLYDAAKIGSIKKTAEKYNYTQSGLLYMINSVEEELQLRLLQRDHRGVSLTAEGQELMSYYDTIEKAIQAFNDKAANLLHTADNELSIAAYPILAEKWIPDVINQLSQTYPQLRCRIKAGYLNIPDWIDNGLVNLGLVEKHVVGNRPYVDIVADEMYCYVREDSELTKKAFVSFEDLESYSILFSTYNRTNPGIKKISDWLEQKKISFKYTIDSQDGNLLISMVSQGMGVTVLSSVYSQFLPANVRALPFEDPLIVRLVLLHKKQKLSDVEKMFIQILKGYAKKVMLKD